MSTPVSDPGNGPLFEDFDGGFTWLVDPQEPMQRASHALATEAGVWLVDPLDVDGLDDHLADEGPVAGVVLLLDRHDRDAASIATRHEVPVSRPPGVDRAVDAPTQDLTDGLPGTAYSFLTVQDWPFWQEAGLWNGTTLVIPESLGTNEFSCVRGERLGVNPFVRPFPPRHLAASDPERVLVGHGRPLLEDASPAFRTALSTARRRLPSAWLNMAKEFLRA